MAGLVAGLLSKDPRFADLGPVTGEDGMVTGELDVTVHGWHVNISISVYGPPVGFDDWVRDRIAEVRNA